MKLTFKTAVALLEAGKPFKAKDSEHYEYTFIYYRDEHVYDDEFESSHWAEESFNSSNFQFISFLPRKMHEVGDKVIITDDIKETSNWYVFKEFYPSMKATVTAVLNYVNGLRYELDDGCIISSSYLIADTEEETMPEETIDELKEIKKVFDEFVEKTNKLFE